MWGHFLLFCTPTWPSHHVDANQEYPFVLINKIAKEKAWDYFNNGWFSQWRHQIVKSKRQGVLNFYLSEVENDLENILFSSFEFHDVFRFENTTFWISELSPCQEPMTRSLQLYCVHVTAFSQTDLFLDWISREWDSHRSPMTNYKKLSWRHRVPEPELPLFFELIRGKG